jgi:hypothetical protein
MKISQNSRRFGIPFAKALLVVYEMPIKCELTLEKYPKIA